MRGHSRRFRAEAFRSKHKVFLLEIFLYKKSKSFACLFAAKIGNGKVFFSTLQSPAGVTSNGRFDRKITGCLAI